MKEALLQAVSEAISCLPWEDRKTIVQAQLAAAVHSVFASSADGKPSAAELKKMVTPIITGAIPTGLSNARSDMYNLVYSAIDSIMSEAGTKQSSLPASRSFVQKAKGLLRFQRVS